MASDDKISIPVGIDASGITDDINKASAQVGKATVGVARGVSAAMGQALGPFGELIEKADAFSAALGGITTASKFLAIGVGAASIATVYTVKRAVEAYGEMRDAIDEAAESQKRLNEQRRLGESVQTLGIAAGQEGEAVKKIDARIAELTAENKATVAAADDMGGLTEVQKLSPSQIKANQDMIAELQAARAKVVSGQATARGEARLGNELLSPSARKAMEEASLQSTAASMGTGSLDSLKAQREAARAELANLAAQPVTQTSAAQANSATAWIEKLDRLINALEALKTVEEKRQEAIDKEEGPRSGSGADTTWNDGSRGYVGGAASRVPGASSGVPMGYGVGGYTNVGGGGNIYGNVAGAEDRFRSLTEDVAAIAEKVVNGNTTLVMQP